MNRILLAVWLLAAMLLGFIQPAAEAGAGYLYPVKVDNKVGFIDETGNMVIAPVFQNGRMFMGELTAVQSAENGQWGYIDRSGRFVIAPQYYMAFDFSEGLGEVWLERDKGKGYINPRGELVIQGSGGKALHGLVRLLEKDSTVFTDLNGEVVFTAPGNAWQVGGGLIAFVSERKMGFMNRSGQVVIEPRYLRENYWADHMFEADITAVGVDPLGKRQPQFGFINRQGQVITAFQYDWAGQFFNGLAVVVKDGRYGYVNTAGQVAIPLQFEEAWNFSEGLAAVKVNGRWGFIDTQGNMVIEPQYLGRMWGSPMLFQEGRAAVRSENGTGFINQQGQVVVPLIYRVAEEFCGGLALLHRNDGKSAYVNRQGQVVWPKPVSENE